MATNLDYLIEAKEAYGLKGVELMAFALMELADTLRFIAYGNDLHPGALEAISMAMEKNGELLAEATKMAVTSGE